MKPGYFTTVAVDNIDHEPSSLMATKSFHGSSIIIFQHCNANENIEVENFFIEQNNADLSSLYLPEEYASILPTPGGKPEPPIYLHESANTVSSENGLSQGWVDKLSRFTDDIPLAYFSNYIELIHMGIIRSTCFVVLIAITINPFIF